jgi:hypothetical protein
MCDKQINMRNPYSFRKEASAKIEDRVKMYYTETYYFNGQKMKPRRILEGRL